MRRLQPPLWTDRPQAVLPPIVPHDIRDAADINQQRAAGHARAGVAQQQQQRRIPALERLIQPRHLGKGSSVLPVFKQERVQFVRFEKEVLREMQGQPDTVWQPLATALRDGALGRGVTNEAARMTGSIMVAPGSMRITLEQAGLAGDATMTDKQRKSATSKTEAAAQRALADRAAAAQTARAAVLSTGAHLQPFEDVEMVQSPDGSGLTTALTEAMAHATGGGPQAATELLQLFTESRLLLSGSWALRWAQTPGLLMPGSEVSTLALPSPGDVDVTAPFAQRLSITTSLTAAGYTVRREETWDRRSSTAPVCKLRGLTEFIAGAAAIPLQVTWSDLPADATSYTVADAQHKVRAADMDISSPVFMWDSGRSNLILLHDVRLRVALKSGVCTVCPLRLLQCCSELGSNPAAIARALRAICAMSEHARNHAWLRGIGLSVRSARVRVEGRLFGRMLTSAVGQRPTGSTLAHLLRRVGDRALAGLRIDVHASVARLNALLAIPAAATALHASADSKLSRISCDPAGDAARAAMPIGTPVCILDTGISLTFDGYMSVIQAAPDGSMHLDLDSGRDNRRMRVGSGLLADARGRTNLQDALQRRLRDWGAPQRPAAGGAQVGAALAGAALAVAGAAGAAVAGAAGAAVAGAAVAGAAVAGAALAGAAAPQAAIAQAVAVPAPEGQPGAVYCRLRRLFLTRDAAIAVVAARHDIDDARALCTSTRAAACAAPHDQAAAALAASARTAYRLAGDAEVQAAAALAQSKEDNADDHLAAAARRRWDASLVQGEAERLRHAQAAMPGERVPRPPLPTSRYIADSPPLLPPAAPFPPLLASRDDARVRLDAAAAAHAPLLAAASSFAAEMGPSHFAAFSREHQACSLLVASINTALASLPRIAGKIQELRRRNPAQAAVQLLSPTHTPVQVCLWLGMDWMRGRHRLMNNAARLLDEVLLSFDVRAFAGSEAFTSCTCVRCGGWLSRRGPRLPGVNARGRPQRAGHTAQCEQAGCGVSMHHDFGAAIWQGRALLAHLRSETRPSVLTPGALAADPKWFGHAQ